jgi:putative intracellular protease/amidase
VDVASVAGGRAPLDPTSEAQAFQTDATRRFAADPEAQRALTDTLKLAAIRPEVYDAVFYSGGLGPVFDLSEDRTSVALIEAMHRAGKP